VLNVYYGEGNEYVAHSDFGMAKLMPDIIKNSKKKDFYGLYTSTENIIYFIKVAIYRGEIDPNDVIFYFKDRTLKLDKTARPINGSYPSTYLDDCLNTLIGLDDYKPQVVYSRKADYSKDPYAEKE
jgi:hypothetical protein